MVRDTFVIDAGARLVLSPEMLADLGDAVIRMSVTSMNAINADDLANSLAQYPFRCSEQTTSRATGLLLGRKLNLSDTQRDRELNNAFVTLQNRRGYSGIINLWPGYGEGDMFLHAYATDLLGLADDRGYEAAAALRTGLCKAFSSIWNG